MLKPYFDDGHGHVIYLGDCREILPQLPKVDLVLTDPPYGIGKLMVGGRNTGHWNMLSGGNPWDPEAPEMGPVVDHATNCIVWGGNYFPFPPSRCWLIWRKTNSVPTQADAEMAWTTFDACTRVFEFPTGGSYVREHPTQKPLELMSWCLSFAPDAETILDPFMGSGTTLRAAKDLGRKAIGIEIHEPYCEVAAKRLSQEVLEFSDS